MINNNLYNKINEALSYFEDISDEELDLTLNVLKQHTKTKEQILWFVRTLLARQHIMFEDINVLGLIIEAVNMAHDLSTLPDLNELKNSYSLIKDESNRN